MSNQRELTIPLGRRIGEIMEEKGDAFSYRAFGERIGMSKDTLSRIINGERYIKPSELDKICRGLNISKERLLQTDSFKDYEYVHNCLEKSEICERTLSSAKKLVRIAVGVTEKSRVINMLGRVYFEYQLYDDAYQSFSDARKYAMKIHERFAEKKLLAHAVKNLLLTMAMRNDFKGMGDMMDEAERILKDQPIHMGTICYFYVRLAEQVGDLEEAKRKSYQSLYYFEQVGKVREIAAAMVNIAHIEFKTKNYHQAKTYLEKAIEMFEQRDHAKWIAIKDYAKVLLALNDIPTAVRILEKYIQNTELKKHSTIHTKFYLLLALAHSTEKHVHALLNLQAVSDVI